jgi:methyl-accepting chemotaxis protein
MGIRIKILSGFLILVTMLIVAGAWSIYELTTVGVSVQGLLDDNYQSINAAKKMMEGLEREDSGILLLVSGNRVEGRQILLSADSLFQEGFQIAKNNVTIPDENKYVVDIKTKYGLYKALWSLPVVDTKRENNLEWYFRDVHKTFLEVKKAVEDLMTINDQVMYQTASQLKNKAHRAVMPGVVAILAALIFTLLFNYFINYYVVSPIIRIRKGIGRFLENNEMFDARIETKDELMQLSESVQKLIHETVKQKD